jgi:hypothetical protein
MQDVDRPNHIQALPEPARARRPSVETKALRFMSYPESLDGFFWHCGRRRHLRQGLAIRPPESQGPVRLARDLVALLVHGPMMPAAEQREVRERRWTAVRPVTKMMPLPEADAAAGETATSVPMVERSSQGGRNRPRPSPDLHQAPTVVVVHHHPARVARQALGRFRGNVCTAIEYGLARLIWIGQHLGIDMDHHLVALARGTGIEVVQGRLREQGQGIGLLLGQRGCFRGNVSGVRRRLIPSTSPLVQGLAGRGQRLGQQRSDLRVEPPGDHDHAVLVGTDVQSPAGVAARGLPSLGPPVYRPPAAYDPLDVGGRACAPHGEQASFRLRRGHASEGAHLGVRELPAGEGLSEEGQRPEGARDADPFTSGPQIEPDSPAQPSSAGAEARVPTPACVETRGSG